MTERRYNEQEVAAIFERASDAEARGRAALPSAEGMTLAELESIGSQVGLPPGFVSQAARTLDRVRSEAATTRTFLGFPIGVARTVELGRRLSDEEWERIVVDLRETFHARGRVQAEGSFRQWTNGNLHALLEPGEAGHRLRLGTTKGDARAYMGVGLAMLAMAAAVFGANEIAAGTVEAGASRVIAMLSTFGVGMFGFGALRLPGWARRRREQMETVAARVLGRAPGIDDDGGRG